MATLSANDYVQLSSAGQLHRMEAGHAGKNASAPIRGDQVTLDKYELCNLPGCFPEKAKAPEPAKVDEPKPAKKAPEPA